MSAERRAQAAEILTRFAERTGVLSAREPERYLWTDAFAACTWLGLGEIETALRLVDQVHHTLGVHRDDDARRGWLSGLGAEEGESHPTRGGLRIGKKLRERRPDEPFDERLEWDRDGQYFHYLTRWMHTLDQTARWTGRALFNGWAIELADVAHRAFTYAPAAGGRRMYWKMSVDLSRPLVASMGHHDPLDGYLTCVQLDATAAELGSTASRLGGPAADFAAMIGPRLETVDPLGLGGLLVDACRLEQLVRRSAVDGARLLGALLAAAAFGLEEYVRGGDLRRPETQRLAFRELGLAIGLAGLERMPPDAKRGPAATHLAGLLPLRAEIEAFWGDERRRLSPLWREHANINDVMLAASLVPDGYLDLRALR